MEKLRVIYIPRELKKINEGKIPRYIFFLFKSLRVLIFLWKNSNTLAMVKNDWQKDIRTKDHWM